jgi:hypothetical protein
LCLGSAALYGCSDDSQQVRRTSRPYRAPAASQTSTDTPTVENTEERGEEVRKVCNRKAQTSSDMSRCWMSESERRGAKKFEAEIKIMLLVSPDGKAQEVNVLNSTPEFKDLESCIVDVVKSWDFPSGQTVAPAQCNFLLRPLM